LADSWYDASNQERAMSNMIERVVAAIQEASHGNAYLSAAFHEASPEIQEAVACAAIKALRLTSADWSDTIRYYDDIDGFNDTIDMILGVAPPTEPAA
jgi:hypothetical protein